MYEILGYDLYNYFNKLGIINTGVKCTYKSDSYEVWEVNDAVFSVMCKQSNEEFYKVAGYIDFDKNYFPWWRYSEGSVLFPPDEKVIINKEEIAGWKWKESLDPNEVPEYSDLLSYLCNEIGASTEKNVCAVAKDLAKYNGMTMGELFTKLQPVRGE